MDLKLSYNWIKEHLQTNATAYDFAKYLSLCGPSIERITPLKKDFLLHIEVTTNRIDMASVTGIAREANAILPRFGLKTHLRLPTAQKIKITSVKKIIVRDPQKLSMRTIGVVFENINNWATPIWMKERLEASGVRSLNAPIDITNYVMLEVGHPLHIFDFDLIEKQQIIIDLAQKGEKITTLDEKTYTLSGGDVVFRNISGKIIDLPGIMGTENSVVKPNQTKKFLLFSDDVSPAKIRKTSMELGLRTLAAQYNEKGIDPELGLVAIKRAVDLFITICKPKAIGKVVDYYPNPIKPQAITVSAEEVSHLLGTKIGQKEIHKIMTSLNFEAKIDKGGNLLITPPSYRVNDIQIPQDIVEEVARIFGYHQIEGVLPQGTLPVNSDLVFDFEWAVKNHLVNLGGIEVYTSSLVAKDDMLHKGLKLSNPMGADTEYLRDNLTTSIKKALVGNTKKQDRIFLFEMANIYLPKKNDLPDEKNILSLGFTGYSFYDATEIVYTLLTNLGIKFQIKPTATGLSIWVGKNNLGEISLVGNYVIANFSVSALHQNHQVKSYQSVNPNPPQIEDLKFEIAPQVYLGEAMNAMLSIPSVTKVELLDQFDRFVTFRVFYQSPNKTLTDKEVTRIRQKLTDLLSAKFAFKYQA